MQIRKGDIIYAPGQGGSWWFVYGKALKYDFDHTQNSVFVCGQVPRGFRGEWPHTSWDDEVIRDQGARIVPADEVPSEVWAKVGLWALTNKGE